MCLIFNVIFPLHYYLLPWTCIPSLNYGLLRGRDVFLCLWFLLSHLVCIRVQQRVDRAYMDGCPLSPRDTVSLPCLCKALHSISQGQEQSASLSQFSHFIFCLLLSSTSLLFGLIGPTLLGKLCLLLTSSPCVVLGFVKVSCWNNYTLTFSLHQ